MWKMQKGKANISIVYVQEMLVRKTIWYKTKIDTKQKMFPYHKSLCRVLAVAEFQSYLWIFYSSDGLCHASVGLGWSLWQKHQHLFSSVGFVCFPSMTSRCLSKFVHPLWSPLLGSQFSLALEILFFFSFVRQKVGRHVVSEFAATETKTRSFPHLCILVSPTLTAVQHRSWVGGVRRQDKPHSASVSFAMTSAAVDMEDYSVDFHLALEVIPQSIPQDWGDVSQDRFHRGERTKPQHRSRWAESPQCQRSHEGTTSHSSSGTQSPPSTWNILCISC